MSGTHVPHLQRRNGIFHLRVRVPRDLKLRIGILEVRRSLQTSSPTRARLLAAIYAQRVLEAFKVVRKSEFTRDDAKAFVLACFFDLQAEFEDGYVPSSDFPELAIMEQRELAKENIQELQAQLRNRQFGNAIALEADERAAVRGWKLSALPADRQLDVLEGMTRALIEQQRVFLVRLQDRLVPHIPLDPLFAEVNCNSLPGAPAVISNTGPKLGAGIASYLENGRKKWTEKTHAGRVRQLAYLEEHLGPDRLLAAVTPDDVRSYRDAILRLRSNHRKGSRQTFAEKQTDNEAHRIQPKTASLIFETAKAFFRWCKADEGYITKNPAADIRIDAPKKAKGKKPRRPFSKAELEKLFSAPVFTGSQSIHRRFEVGSFLVKDANFWIPVLGYYTGARLGEIVQLHVEDVNLSGPIPFIEITDENSGAAGAEGAKHLKSLAALRRIPIHPDLLELGLGEFVAARRGLKRPSKRLFYRIPYGADGQPSTVFSKWFARFMDKSGLNDPALVFHSFRHNAEDAFRNASQPQYVIDRIIGHADGATSAAYGDGIDLETAYAAVQAMKLPTRLPILWSYPKSGEGD